MDVALAKGSERTPCCAMGAIFVVCTVVVGALVTPAHAQPRADLQAAPRFTLDAGANAVSWTAFPGVTTSSPRQSGVTLAPAVHIDGARHTLDLTGSWTNDPTGGGIVQGGGMLSLYTPSRAGLRGEFLGNANGSRLADGFTSARAMGGARLHLSRASAGGWIGAQGGVAGYDSAWRRIQQPEVGAWYALPAADGSEQSSGALVFTVTPTVISLNGETDRYTDIEAGARLVRGRAEMGVSVGTRTARSASVALLGGAQAWGTVAATVWMTPLVAITASGGTYPVDAMMRFPGGRFVSAGLRMAFGRVPTAAAGASAAAAPGVAAAMKSTTAESLSREPRLARPPLSVSTTSGELRTVRITVPVGTKRVELAGSFSNWDSVMLTSGTAGVFVATVRMRPGRHQIAVRLDGGPWMAPRDLVTVRDEFGGESGLLVIER